MKRKTKNGAVRMASPTVEAAFAATADAAQTATQVQSELVATLQKNIVQQRELAERSAISLLAAHALAGLASNPEALAWSAEAIADRATALARATEAKLYGSRA